MRGFFCFLSLLGFLIAGCSESGDLELVTDEAGFSVGLIDAGEGDTVTLRVASEPGTTQKVQTSISQTQELEIGGRSQTVETSQTMDLTYVIRDVADGVITVEGTYEDVTFDLGASVPGQDEVIEQLTEAFVGTTAVLELTDRGSVVSGDLPFDGLELPGLPPGFMDQMMSSIEDNLQSLSIPTPVEPIGVGGSWSASAELEMMEMPMTIETIITLTDITAEAAVGELEQTITFVEGEVELFGVSVTIDGGQMTSTGTITYPLEGAIMPLFDQEAEGSVTMSANGQTLDQTMTMRITTTER